MRPDRNWATAVVAGALFFTVAAAASAAPADPATVYSNIPSTLAGNYGSAAYEAKLDRGAR
jgi:hypothetical protein